MSFGDLTVPSRERKFLLFPLQWEICRIPRSREGIRGRE